MVQWLRLQAPNAEGQGSIPGWGTRSHMPQLRVRVLQLKIPHATTKTRCSQINKYIFLINEMRQLKCLTETIYIYMDVCILSDQIRSVAQSCPTLCDPMNHSTPGLPVHHQLPEFTQTHVHQVIDAIQPSHPLSSPSPLAPNPAQHQSLFQ